MPPCNTSTLATSATLAQEAVVPSVATVRYYTYPLFEK